jgi:predicted TIM-barrel fold metal-dependent hydrolase
MIPMLPSLPGIVTRRKLNEHALPAMNRRTFLKQSAAAAASLAALPSAPAATPAVSRIVDTHTHFYDPTRPQGVPWPGKGTPLDRPVLPRDWLAVAAPLGVTETVVVEASKWLEDNAWILDLAAREKCIVGFVGNLSPQEPDFAQHLKRFAANPIFRGIRVSGAGFMERVDDPAFRTGIALLADLGLALDLNGPPALHAPAARLAADFPALRIVIDHVGSAGDPTKLSPAWREGMRVLGARRNVSCKVSGLIEQTEASRQKWGEAPRDTAYYAPILDHCRECFGEDRLVYGSNWPVCEKGGAYADQLRVVNEYFTARGAAAREKYFSGNSRAAYRWVERV